MNDNSRLRRFRVLQGGDRRSGLPIAREDFASLANKVRSPAVNPYRLWRVGKRGLKFIDMLPYQFVEEVANWMICILEPEGWEDLGDWQLVGQCPTSYTGPKCYVTGTTYYNYQYFINFANNCLSGQGLYGDDEDNIADPWSLVSTTRRTVVFGSAYDVSGSWRARCVEAFTRPNQGAFPKPYWSEGKALLLAAEKMPRELLRVMSEAPHMQPVASPRPAMLVPPLWSDLPKWRHPQRVASYGSVRVNPNTKRVPLDYSISYSTGRKPVPSVNYHTKAPPPKNTKETKWKVPPALYGVIKFVNQATEAAEFIDCVYDALPEQYQARYRDTKYRATAPSYQAKLRAIAENWEHIDPLKLLYNLGVNQIEDTLYGKLGQAGAVISKDVGRLPYLGYNSFTRKISGVWYKYRRYDNDTEN